MVEELTTKNLQEEAASFVNEISSQNMKELNGVTDGKHIGTYLEKSFKNNLKNKYVTENWGKTSNGIDLPSINTDIKFTSYKQPQSSLPFKSAEQKIFGLGYNLLVFVYYKNDNETNNIDFKSVSFINYKRTADFLLTKSIRNAIENGGNDADIEGLLIDKSVPADNVGLKKIIQKINNNSLLQGYLTISNALQWRANYSRIIEVAGQVKGINKLYGE